MITGAIIGLLLTLMIYLVVALRDRRFVSEKEEYFYFGNRLSGTHSSATIFASGMSFATVLIALLNLGLAYGTAFLWAPITYCIGWLLLLPFARQIKAGTLDGSTLHGYLGKRYSSNTLRKIGSAATIVGFLGTFATEIIAGTILFEALGWTRQSAFASIGIFALITILYSAMGGFRSVIRSDVIQTVLIVIGVVMMLGLSLLLRRQAGLDGIFDAKLITVKLPILFAINLALINIPFPFVDMSAWQRISAAHSFAAWKKGTIGAVSGFLLTWPMLILGAVVLGGVLDPTIEPFVALVQNSQKLAGKWSPILGFLLFPALVAAMLSTADTFLNAAGHSFIHDIDPYGINFTLQSRKIINRARIQLTILGLIGFMLCLILRTIGFGIVELIFAVYGAALALFPSVIVGLLIPSKEHLGFLKRWSICSVIVGFAAGWANGLYGIICPNNTIMHFIRCDPYSSPLYSFSSAMIIFIIGCIIHFKELQKTYRSK